MEFGMRQEHQRVLVLNADFMPLGTIGWRRAMALSFVHGDDPTQGVEVIDFYKNDSILAANGKKFPIPAVVRTPVFVRQKNKSVPFSRKNLFIRDMMTCQYCGETFAASKLTFDHVIPRAKWDKRNGTPTHWENIVTCCIPCNRKKADHLVHEVGMKLLRIPKKPNSYQFILGISPWSYIPEEWKVYLTPIYKDLFQKIKSNE